MRSLSGPWLPAAAFEETNAAINSGASRLVIHIAAILARGFANGEMT